MRRFAQMEFLIGGARGNPTMTREFMREKKFFEWGVGIL